MATTEAIKLEGTVIDVIKGGQFKILLENGHHVTGHLSGKMRKNHIRVLAGDRVDVELSPYDLTKGRVMYRYK